METKETVSILIVDDNEAIRYVMNKILQKQGFEVDVAGTGGEAIQKIATAFYELAIIDLNLPDMSGLDVYKKLSTLNPQIKKIILTGLPPDDKEKDSTTEPIEYLLKPLSAEQLLEAIKQKLTTPQQ